MKILNYNIPEELQNNSFIVSIKDNEKLSDAQLNVLKSILGIEETLNDFKTKTVKVYLESFYRTDYHGDYLQDYKFVFDVNEENLNDTIEGQYEHEAYVNKYKFKETINVPGKITNLDLYYSEYKNDFEFFMKKLQNNKFRKISTKNKCILAITSNNFNDNLINDVNGSKWRNR